MRSALNMQQFEVNNLIKLSIVLLLLKAMLQQMTRFCHVSTILRTSRKHCKIELYGHHFKNNRRQILQYIFKGLQAIRNIMQSLNSVGQIIIEIIYVEETMSSRHSHVHLSYFSFQLVGSYHRMVKSLYKLPV